MSASGKSVMSLGNLFLNSFSFHVLIVDEIIKDKFIYCTLGFSTINLIERPNMRAKDRLIREFHR